jgi:hypothetical protein
MNPAAVLAALASAALFGVSAPAAKALLGVVHPVILGGLFYCGADIGIAPLRLSDIARQAAMCCPGAGKPSLTQSPL